METTVNRTETTIRHLGEFIGQEVTLKGWLYSKRSSGKIRFLLMRDGSGIVQCVAVKNELSPEAWEAADKLTQESSLILSGKVREDSRSPGGFELSVTDVEAISIAPEYPISPKEHGVDFLMNHRHLWLRSRRQQAIMKIRHTIVKAMRDFMDDHEFTLIDTPILTPAACEGTTNLFETDYFGEKAFLAQSGQLYLEAAAMAFGKAYCFGPTFRAEKSKTRRHLMEFWMMEAEMAFADYKDNMDVQEQLVSFIVQTVLAKHKPELELLERDLSKLENIKAPFPRITYDEAVQILVNEGVEFEWGNDLGGGDETVLANKFDRPVFVTHYPTKVKAFYMKRDPSRPEVVLCSDLLAPEGYGEVIGASQRNEDFDELAKLMEEHGMPREAYEWFLDLRKYGSVPHSGFGIGLERTVAWICGLDHVRETIPFARMLTRIYP